MAIKLKPDMEINEIVQEYFNDPPIDCPRWQFSQNWIAKVLKQVKKGKPVDAKAVRSSTQIIHLEKFADLDIKIQTRIRFGWGVSVR